MNYKRIHDEIINNAKNRSKPNVYCELHHIVMRSMGGNDEKDNVVLLTAREHFIIHWLLYKILRNKKSTFAFFAMTKPVGNGRIRYTSKSFAYAREAMSKYMSNNQIGEKNHSFGKFGERSKSYGQKRTEEQKKKMSDAAKKRFEVELNPKALMIKNITTGEIFKSITEAKEKHKGNINYALKTGGKANGHLYAYVDSNKNEIKKESTLIGYPSGEKHRLSKKVINKTTNEVFNTIIEASKSIGVSPTAISISIKENRCCKGNYYEFYT